MRRCDYIIQLLDIQSVNPNMISKNDHTVTYLLKMYVIMNMTMNNIITSESKSVLVFFMHEVPVCTHRSQASRW